MDPISLFSIWGSFLIAVIAGVFFLIKFSHRWFQQQCHNMGVVIRSIIIIVLAVIGVLLSYVFGLNYGIDFGLRITEQFGFGLSITYIVIFLFTSLVFFIEVIALKVIVFSIKSNKSDETIA